VRDVAPIAVRTLGSDDRAAAEALWTRLDAELDRPGLTCSWDWTRTWLEVYGPGVPHRFVVGERDGRPCGIALLAWDAEPRRGLRPRTLHVGTAGEPRADTVAVEPNRLLVAPEHRAEFARELVAVGTRERGWERVSLDGFVPADAAALTASRTGFELRVEESPVADLGAADGDVVSALPSSRRQRVRRALRHFGPLETEWAQDEAGAFDVLDELIALHQQRWTAAGRAGVFASPRFTDFHRSMIGRLLPRREAVLFRVRRADETIGCVYCLVERGRALFYAGGIRRYADNRLRAGMVVHALCMQACRDRGLSEYDFLSPGDRYKRELATRSDRLVWAELYRMRPRPQAWRAAKLARAAARANLSSRRVRAG
jgi:CelD/BcsL family acetyltransferase involved in cellulose biosynthesis